MKKEIITDHDLLKLANDWYETIDCVNVGLKSAFAAGYRLAEQQANGLSTGEGQLTQPAVIKSVCATTPICKIKIDDESCNPTDCPYFEAQTVL
jgi:hypothetical protein